MRARCSAAWIAALGVALLAAPALALHHRAPQLAVARGQAVHAALLNARVTGTLRPTGWSAVSVTAVDSRLVRVSFFAHGRVVVEAAVRGDGRVGQIVAFSQLHVPYGNWVAYQPALLVGLAALFILVSAVSPWRRLRNLDVAAALSLTAPVILLQQRYVLPSVLAAVPGLLYLMVRCAWIGLAPERRPPPAVPLLAALVPGIGPGARGRLLRILVIALALTYVMVTVSSNNGVDVIYAVMEGATRLVHGVLPYGHLPGDVVHGDTYPLLSYLLYVPLASVFPVDSTWATVDAPLALAAAAALVAGWATFRVLAGARATRTVEQEEAGLRASLAWLAFPPLLITASTGTTDVVLAAMLALALLLWRRPAASTALLAAAAWFKLSPAAVLPLWLAPLRGRRLAGALAAVAGVSVPLLVLLVVLGGGVQGPEAMLHAVAYQFSRDSLMSPWSVPWARPFQPLFQAAVLGLIAAAALKLRHEHDLAHDPTRVAALCAAILVGLQLAADYWAFLYLAWVMPLACLSLLQRGEPAPAAAASRAAVPASRPVLVR